MRRVKRIGLGAIAVVVSCGGQAVEGDQAGGTGGTGGTGGFIPTSTDGGTGGIVSVGGTGGWGNAGGALSSCTNTDFTGFDPAVAANPFISAVYAFGDGDANGPYPSSSTDPGTTFCLDSPVNSTICMNGLAREACAGTNPCDYHRWGAGVGFGLGTRSSTGVIIPFDANAVGVAGVKFTLSGVTIPIRVQITMPDDPTTGDVNESVGFVYGGGVADVAVDGTVTARFWEFVQPAWGYPALGFDSRNIDSLQFVVPTAAGFTATYDFCVSDVQLVDAQGNVVTAAGGAGP